MSDQNQDQSRERPAPGAYCYDFPRPSLTVDIVLFRGTGAAAQVLLIQRMRPPYEGEWALPGGYVDQGEAPETAAHRELREETGLEEATLVQVGAFGAPERDPRGWTVSVAYAAHLPPEIAEGAAPHAGDDAADSRWWPLNDLPELAFDHPLIIATAVARLGVPA